MKCISVSGWYRRICSFMDERHPLPSLLALSSMVYLGPATFVAHVHGIGASLLSPMTVIGICSVFNFYLILRLCDELKDMDLDAKRFPDRPLPSGRVAPYDLYFLLIVIIILTLVLNIGTTITLLAATGILGYEFLMFKFFFVPDILRRRPLVNLITHNPVFALIPLYSVLIFAGKHNIPLSALEWDAILTFIVMIWMPFLGWEIARKLRVPEQHDPYDIYSPALGHVGAILSVIATQIISLLIALYFLFNYSLIWVYAAIVISGFAMAVTGNILFLINPNKRSLQLKPFAEIFIVIVLMSQFAGFGSAIL